MKRVIDVAIHPSKWSFVSYYAQVGEWERVWTWLCVTLRIVWPPAAIAAEPPPPLYAESKSTTFLVPR